MLGALVELEQLPSVARPLVKRTKAVVTAVGLEAHRKRVAWARAEGYTGMDADRRAGLHRRRPQPLRRETPGEEDGVPDAPVDVNRAILRLGLDRFRPRRGGLRGRDGDGWPPRSQVGT